MVFLAAMLSAAAASPPSIRVNEQARVSITVLQPYRSSPASWNPAKNLNQRETVRKEADGREIRLRLTEFE